MLPPGGPATSDLGRTLNTAGSGTAPNSPPRQPHRPAHSITPARPAVKRPNAAALARRQTVVAALLAGSSLGGAAARGGRLVGRCLARRGGRPGGGGPGDGQPVPVRARGRYAPGRGAGGPR